MTKFPYQRAIICVSAALFVGTVMALPWGDDDLTPPKSNKDVVLKRVDRLKSSKECIGMSCWNKNAKVGSVQKHLQSGEAYASEAMNKISQGWRLGTVFVSQEWHGLENWRGWSGASRAVTSWAESLKEDGSHVSFDISEPPLLRGVRQPAPQPAAWVDGHSVKVKGEFTAAPQAKQPAPRRSAAPRHQLPQARQDR